MIPLKELISKVGQDHEAMEYYSLGWMYEHLAGMQDKLDTTDYRYYAPFHELIFCYDVSMDHTLQQIMDRMQRFNGDNSIITKLLVDTLPGTLDHLPSWMAKDQLNTLCPALKHAYRSVIASDVNMFGAKTYNISEEQFNILNDITRGTLGQYIVSYGSARILRNKGHMHVAKMEAAQFFQSLLFQMSPASYKTPLKLTDATLMMKTPLELLQVFLPNITMDTIHKIAESAEGLPLSSPLMKEKLLGISVALAADFAEFSQLQWSEITERLEGKIIEIQSASQMPLMVLVYHTSERGWDNWKTKKMNQLLSEIFHTNYAMLTQALGFIDATDFNSIFDVTTSSYGDSPRTQFYSISDFKNSKHTPLSDDAYYKGRHMTQFYSYSQMRVRDLQKMYDIPESDFMNKKMSELWPQYDGFGADGMIAYYGNQALFPGGDVFAFLNTTYDQMASNFSIDIDNYDWNELRQLAMGK